MTCISAIRTLLRIMAELIATKAFAFPSTLRSELPNEVIFRYAIRNFRCAILIIFSTSTSPSVNLKRDEESTDPFVLSQLSSVISLSLLLGHCLHLSSDTMLILGMFYA